MVAPRIRVPILVGLGSDAQAIANANAHLGPGQGTQTQQSWDQMRAAEDALWAAAQNGVPNDPNAQGQLAFETAMGIAAYAAPPYAALMAGLYAVAQAIAPELYNIGLLTPPKCTQTGPKASISDWSQPSAASIPGVAAALWPMVADQLTKMVNCEGYMPSAILYQGFQGIWNNAHDSSSQTTIAVVPFGLSTALGPTFDLPSVLPYFGASWDGSGLSTDDQLKMRNWQTQGALTPLSFNTGPLLPDHQPQSGGPAPAPASKSTAAAKVAASGVVLSLGVLTYAWIAGHSVDFVLSHLWNGTKRFVRRVVGETEHLTPNPLGLFERQSTTVQSLLFPRPEFSPSSARSWARKHGYRAGKVHSTGGYVRLRQKPPSSFRRGSFRTISFGGSGIKAVIGHLR